MLDEDPAQPVTGNNRAKKVGEARSEKKK